MSTSRLVLTLDTNMPVATLQDILTAASSDPRVWANKLDNFVRGMKGGARTAAAHSGVVTSGTTDAVSASLAGTFSGTPTAAETIAVNGVTITFVASSSPTNNQVSLAGTPSTTTLASRLAAAINASTSDALSGVVSASSSAAVCTVSCLIPGVIGNSVTVADSATNFAWAGGATALASGAGKLPVLVSYSFGK